MWRFLESIPVQDIFQKYPATYEGVIPTLCVNLNELDEPEAKASLSQDHWRICQKSTTLVSLLILSLRNPTLWVQAIVYLGLTLTRRASRGPVEFGQCVLQTYRHLHRLQMYWGGHCAEKKWVCVHITLLFHSDEVSLFSVYRLADDWLLTFDAKGAPDHCCQSKAENMLDFDDQPATEGEPSGLAAAQVFVLTLAAANHLTDTSNNPQWSGIYLWRWWE
jgi:hypothetical protein